MELIETAIGPMDPMLLKKRVSKNGRETVTQWYFEGKLVKQDTTIEAESVGADGQMGELLW